MYSQSPLLHSFIEKIQWDQFVSKYKLEYCDKTQPTIIDEFKDLSHASTSWKIDQMDLRDKLKKKLWAISLIVKFQEKNLYFKVQNVRQNYKNINLLLILEANY